LILIIGDRTAGQKPGFCRQSCAVTDRFGKKIGFFATNSNHRIFAIQVCTEKSSGSTPQLVQRIAFRAELISGGTRNA
jgi:hypothetical protein